MRRFAPGSVGPAALTRPPHAKVATRYFTVSLPRKAPRKRDGPRLDTPGKRQARARHAAAGSPDDPDGVMECYFAELEARRLEALKQ